GLLFFFFQAEDGIRDGHVTGVQTCALPISYGGEKFFEMLERIAQEPALRIDLIELQYLCIALGFAGKFQLLEQGQTRLAQVQHRSEERRCRERVYMPVGAGAPNEKEGETTR